MRNLRNLTACAKNRGNFVVGTETIRLCHSQPPGRRALDDAPQALVGDADDAGGGQHRHLARQDHCRLLEQEREPASLARPRRLDTLDPVIGAIRARHLGRDVAMVLEKIQMVPSELAEVVRLARPAAVRAGKPRPAIRRHLDVQFLGPLVGIQPLSDQLPRRRHPKPQGG